MSAPAERPVDVLALARVRRRLLARAQVPWLHGEVARRMGERLAIVRDTPQTVLDWGRSVGGGLEVLASAYPAARQACIGDRPPGERASIAPAWWSRLARRPAAPGVRWVSEAEVGAGEAGLVWANMVLHGEPDPLALMQRWHRALRVGGFLCGLGGQQCTEPLDCRAKSGTLLTVTLAANIGFTKRLFGGR